MIPYDMQAPVAVRCFGTNCYTLPLPLPLVVVVVAAVQLQQVDSVKEKQDRSEDRAFVALRKELPMAARNVLRNNQLSIR